MSQLFLQLVVASIPQGHYMVDGLVKELTSSLAKNKNKAKIKIETNEPDSMLKILRLEAPDKSVSVTLALAGLLGIGTNLGLVFLCQKTKHPLHLLYSL